MAAISSIPVAPLTKTLKSQDNIRKLPLNLSRLHHFPSPQLAPTSRPGRIQAIQSPSATTTREVTREDEEAMGVDALKRFINLNLGKWKGTFYQFGADGKLLQEVSTKLSVSSYGEDELISLIQTLYIKQPSSSTSISGHKPETEWAEYKIKETNLFTVDKYQQIGFFAEERAFALRYQTAGMLETILRQGVLGEDDTEEESPKNLKVPSRKPSVVCENCMYSREKDMRARAFHILDPKGVPEMLLIFLEERGDEFPHLPSADYKESTVAITPFLGRWKGHSITKRSGVYGATIKESDTNVLLEIDEKQQVIQDISSTSRGVGVPSGQGVTTNVHWTGTISDSLVIFDGGFQMTLLPGGMYMSSPCDVAKSVQEFRSFHLEFCWMDSPGKRQRLIRTYDHEGMTVSSTYIYESRV